MSRGIDAGTVVIVGATSAIARALAQRFARAGHDLILAARDDEETAKTAADLRLRYSVRVEVLKFDALDSASHVSLIDFAVRHAGHRLAGVIVAHGSLPDQQAAQSDVDLLQQTIATNLTSPILLLSLAANHLEKQRRGFLCALSSVAGDRGRQSNYIYGSAKAGLSAFLQGLRQRMAKCGVSVLTVKPGFVDTAMTWGLPGMFLVATPEKVAHDIYGAIVLKRGVIYTPWFWWGIMAIIRSIPESIFKRLKL